MSASVITIDIAPTFDVGPLTLSWHGLTIALGLVLGGFMAMRVAREGDLDPDRVFDLVLVIALSGMLGARAVFLLENDPGALLNPGEWLAGNGFSFYGGIIFGVPAVGAYLYWRGLGLSYLDVLAAGFPLGMALGRVGDVINGEHYGPESDFFLAVQNTHPEALVPSPAVVITREASTRFSLRRGCSRSSGSCVTDSAVRPRWSGSSSASTGRAASSSPSSVSTARRSPSD